MVKNISKINIDSPKERVWEVLTEPELVKSWQFGCDLQTSWEIGSEIKFRSEWEGIIYEQWGKVLEVRKNDFLKYSLFAPAPGLKDHPENYFIMSYMLTENDGITTLEIIQEDNRSTARQEKEQGEENPVLNALKNTAEGFPS